MTRTMLALTLGLALLGAQPDAAPASNWSDWNADYSFHDRFETALVVDVRPLNAMVLVDGRPIGVARELTARAIPVLPGKHTLEVRAPGHYSYTAEFSADPKSTVNQFRVTLVPR